MQQVWSVKTYHGTSVSTKNFTRSAQRGVRTGEDRQPPIPNPQTPIPNLKKLFVNLAIRISVNQSVFLVRKTNIESDS